MKTLAVVFVSWTVFCSTASAEVRVWTDKSGKHRIKADLVEVRDDQVVLKTATGKQITVSLDRLSVSDRQYVQSQRSSALPADDPKHSPFQVQCIGVRVRKPVPAPETTTDKEEMMMFAGAFEGTELEFLITTTKHIVSVDERSSRLDRFGDDQGTALLKAGERPFGLFFSRVRSDGHAALVKITAPAMPVAGATKLAVEGTLVLRCGEGEKTTESDLIDLKAGGKFKVDETTITVKEGGDGFGTPVQMDVTSKGDSPPEIGTSVTLAGKESFDKIKSVSFFAPDGSPVEKEDSWSIGGMGDFQVSYRLAKKVAKVKLKVVYHEHIKPVRTPVAIEVGMGL